MPARPAGLHATPPSRPVFGRTIGQRGEGAKGPEAILEPSDTEARGRGRSGVERAKNILIFPTREGKWAVMEEASGQHFAHCSDYAEAEDFARKLARNRRVQLLVLDHEGVKERRDFRPWWIRMLFRE
jgi:hypothetical protein